MSKFKVGDRVRIKSWDRMAEEYTEEKYGNGIQLPVSRFDIDMKPLCGLTATIKDIDNEYVKLEDWSNGEEPCWTFTTYMLEKVYTIADSRWFESPTTLSFDFKIDDKDWEEICSAIGIKPVVSHIDDVADAVRYGIWDIKDMKNKEENEMRNEVLELWYERQMKNIEKKYDKYVEEYIEKNYSFVNDYKQLIKDFEDNLEYLYTLNNKDELFILKENTSCNVFKYVIDNEKLSYKANEYFEKDRKEDIELIKKTYAEIRALLSMSSDLEYQQSVLIEYGIIDKKTKRMIANEE